MPLLRSTSALDRDLAPPTCPSTCSISLLPTGALGRKAPIPEMYAFTVTSFLLFNELICEKTGGEPSFLRGLDEPVKAVGEDLRQHRRQDCGHDQHYGQ